MTPRGAAILVLQTAALLAFAAGVLDADVIVEEASKGSVAESGLQPGDVLLAWARRDASGEVVARGTLDSPFDVRSMETEATPRGPVTLEVLRAGAALNVALPPSARGIAARPTLPEATLAHHAEAMAHLAARQRREAAQSWRLAAGSAGPDAERTTTAWLLLQAAEASTAGHDWEAADAAYADALSRLPASPCGSARAEAVRLWAASRQARGDLEGAEEQLREALTLDQAASGEGLAYALDLRQLGAIRDMRGRSLEAHADIARAAALEEASAPGSLALADSLHALALVVWNDDLPRAKAYAERSLALREQRAPSSLELAASLEHLGMAAGELGDPAGGAALVRRAVALQRQLAPESLKLGRSLASLGVLTARQGDLGEAERLGREALAIVEREDPGGLSNLLTHWLLAWVHQDRGDLARAEDHARRGLKIAETVAPGSSAESSMLVVLSNVACDRQDYEAAERYARRALTMTERRYPEGAQVGEVLWLLGEIATQRGDVAEVTSLLQRALAIQERLAPDGATLLRILRTLGNSFRRRGDLAAAKAHYERALALRRKRSTGGAGMAEDLVSLGALHMESGEWEVAERYLAEAKEILERLGLSSATLAAAVHHLGLVYPHTGRSTDAVKTLCQAALLLDNHKRGLGRGYEERSGLDLSHAEYFHSCIAGLVEQDRHDEALQVLERSRAAALLAVLADREIQFTADLPPDLAAERRRLDAEYDRTQAALNGLDAERDKEEVERLLVQFHELRARQASLTEQIRKTSPHFAAVHYPQSLDLAGVRNALDPGTLLLAYSVGTDKTIGFAVQPSSVPGSGLSVFTVPVGAAALRAKVRAFRDVVANPRLARGDLAARAAELYDLLVRPAESQAAGSERLLFSPDGPLHALPFAALVRRPAHGAERESYLVEWKALHVVPSATVYSAIQKTRRVASPSSVLLAAFGDPRYPPLTREQADTIANPEIRSLFTRGVRFAPLPSTREEVDSIARVFGSHAQRYVGAEATEERAKSLGPEVRYLHFACHGTLDERFPLNSGLALTIPEKQAEGQENGLLQAWEIFDRMRLDADLVTLSACRTGLGKEMGGEGLLSLTRAFHHAGARSVLATLWAVSDTSTSRLMTRFYRNLKAGQSRDQALRSAQIDFIRSRPPGRGRPGEDLSHPFRWAAFQLSGGWR